MISGLFVARTSKVIEFGPRFVTRARRRLFATSGFSAKEFRASPRRTQSSQRKERGIQEILINQFLSVSDSVFSVTSAVSLSENLGTLSLTHLAMISMVS